MKRQCPPLGRLLTALLIPALALTLLAGSIAVPILLRPFYYVQIGPLGLEEASGLTGEEIRTAYDQVLDYCLFGGEFRAGVLGWSESGRDHFADAAALFHLDFRLLAVGAAVTLLCLLAARLSRTALWRPLGRGPGFWAGAGLAGVLAVLAGLAAADFYRAFVVFHTLFFPGKDNWVLDWHTDPIILLLPMDYFLSCAVLIAVLLAAGCAGLVIWDLVRGRRPRAD